MKAILSVPAQVSRTCLAIGLVMLAMPLLLAPNNLYAAAGKGMLVIYADTDGTQSVARAVRDSLESDILEIRDLKKRTGMTGYVSTKLDYAFERLTPIEPVHPDLASYPLLVIVTTVRKWKISPPIRTLLAKNSLKENMLFMVTLSDQDIKRYDTYKDDGSFYKRYRRRRIRKWKEKSQGIAEESEAKLLGHYHVTTRGKTERQLADIGKKIFDSLTANPPEWLFKAENMPGWILAEEGPAK